MDKSLINVQNRFMPSDSSGLQHEPPSINSLNRAERARRRGVASALSPVPPVPTLPSFSSGFETISEIIELSVDPSPLTSEHDSLPVSRLPSPASSITRRREWSPVGSRRSSGAANRRSVSPTSHSPCSSTNGDNDRVSEGGDSVSHRTDAPVHPVRARSAPSA
ncbi:hypothetical protein DFJ43DRAFT_1061262 [Lentinula guzmanii]|uniref:Uncharacterized protein n=1 Tax=Lentinula guzmanii TaxID=2804957 RepID=A0AA38JRF9_9AGAR|nr:hypothetical protein DFJ43DRAFT_1061262 [Lentinula guzmanii]